MECPVCKVDIDHDSLYCDQCSQEIFVCPECDKPGKGKMCTSDGISLVSKKNSDVGVSDNIQAGKDAIPIKASTGLKIDPSLIASVTAKPELHLINNNLGLDLMIEDGDIIGHDNGRFANTFAKYEQVSGTHARLKFDSNKGWTIADIGSNNDGSTNGTFHNNIRLNPLQFEEISHGSLIRIANIEFCVQISPIRNSTLRI